VSLGGTPAGAGEAPPPATAILDTQSYWRYFIAWKTEVIRRANGALEPIDDKGKSPAPVEASELPPADWASPDFDDSSWARHRGPLKAASSGMGLICLRGRFEVTDPEEAKGLELAASFTAGAVIYLNGKELVRKGLPEGKIEFDAPADDLPKEAYLDPDGNLYRIGWGDEEKFKDRLRARVREVRSVPIPASMLRKGVNVLAVEIHRPPASELLLTVKPLRWREEAWRGRSYTWWSRIAFDGLRLTARADAEGIVPNVARPRSPGLQVWNQSILQRPLASDYGDPCEPLRPVRLAGPRNAVLSGEMVVGSAAAIKGLQVTSGELKLKGGEGALPASAVAVRFLQFDGDVPGSFGSLTDEAPKEVAPGKDGGAVQPIWLRVRVPRDAKPGHYAGELVIRSEGDVGAALRGRPNGGAHSGAPLQSVAVPIEVRIQDWTLPDPQTFAAHVGLIQSPDTLALKYGVEMWSEPHWRLIEESFQLLGEVGNKVVFIPLLRRTHFGNEHGMVRWIKADGGYRHDFSIAEKYLDTAIKHQGKPEVVCLYCWEPFTGGKYLDHAAKGGGKGMLFSVLDPKTGKLEEAEGPHWGEPAVREFWKPVMDGLAEILRKRGLEGAMMIGVAGDTRPTKEAAEDLRAAAPTAKWVVHSHATASDLWGVPVGYLSDVWGAPSAPAPPKRLYGWKDPFLRTTFPRAGSNTVGAMRPEVPLAMYYVSLEGMLTAGIHGFGRMGADFWPVLKAVGGEKRTLLGRFPESGWGQLSVTEGAPFVLAPGKGGPLPTLRFEMIRVAQQQAEARIFIEKALTDPAAKAKLGEELASRCQKLLDDRTRAIIYARSNGWDYFVSSGWQAREEQLYAAAAEVAAALR
jgi:hypothetical protein